MTPIPISPFNPLKGCLLWGKEVKGDELEEIVGNRDILLKVNGKEIEPLI